MYVGRALSTHKSNTFSAPICEEPSSGCLFLQDDDQQVETKCCLSCQYSWIKTLPFPQNASLTLYPNPRGDDLDACSSRLFFVPVLNEPVSSNRYYIIGPDGKALRCAKLEDKQSCCFCFTAIPITDPRPLDPQDIYQQFKISPSWNGDQGYFNATSVAADGVVPSILSIEFEVKCDRVLTSVGEAKGLDSGIRDHLPEMSFPISCMHSESVAVGEWYCPFMFIKDDIRMKDQVKRSLFYKVTLERRWEQIFTCQNSHGEAKKTVELDVEIATEEIAFAGKRSVTSEVVERMIWEEERVGWIRGDGKVRIKRREEYEGEGLWERFGCFVLVERFVVKRMDGSLVLEYDFKHSHQVKIIWE